LALNVFIFFAPKGLTTEKRGGIVQKIALSDKAKSRQNEEISGAVRLNYPVKFDCRSGFNPTAILV